MKQPIFWILSMMRLAAASEECQECQGEVPESKAGVAMLVKGNLATSATAGASINDINTDGIEREAVLVNYLLNSRTAEFSDSMIKELASMRITPEVAAFIKGTLQQMLPVFGDLEASSANDTKVRNTMHEKFGDLESHLKETQKKADIHKSNAAMERNDHLHCRSSPRSKNFESQKSLYESLNTCLSEEAALKQKKQTAESALGAAENTLKQLVCHDKDAVNQLKAKIAAAGPYASAGRAFLEAKKVYDAKVEECKKIKTNYDKMTTECNSKQTKFEGTMCKMSVTAATGCSAYQAAYAARLSDYNRLSDEIEINSKKRQFEWTHLKRVHCALDALSTHTVDTHAALTKTIEKCVSTSYANDKLKIERKPAPDKLPCLVLPPLPCSSEFLKAEYEMLKAGYEATDCVPCQ